MLISEAMVMLAPYGVERIEMSPHTANLSGAPVWRVTHHGKDYSLESLVCVLTPEDEWEG